MNATPQSGLKIREKLPCSSTAALSHRRRGIRAPCWMLAAYLFLPAFFGCAHALNQSPTPTPQSETPGLYEGQMVVARIERLEFKVHEELLSDGGVIASNVVAFAIVAPESFDTMLFAHVAGHPLIGDRPIRLGDTVTFVLPRNWRNRDLALEELKNLEFVH